MNNARLCCNDYVGADASSCIPLLMCTIKCVGEQVFKWILIFPEEWGRGMHVKLSQSPLNTL